MNIKKYLKNNKICGPLYYKLKSYKDVKMLNERVQYTGKFINRSKERKYLCIALAGYKEFFYPAFFSRLEKFMDERLDVCIITSGLYSEEIDEICKRNDWSYLSTNENNVSLVQNVAINLHPKAELIFKLDEDILITKDYFDHMLLAYSLAKDSEYLPGVIAPIIPINGYGHMRVLEKLQLKKLYEEKFEKPLYAAGPSRMIENSVEVAKFFWGENEYIPTIDQMNAQFWNGEKKVLPCPIRFSIGAILFERQLWEKMGYFKVSKKGVAMGGDESQLCSYCCEYSKPIMVSDNVVVGHLGFGPQNAAMKEYYLGHKEKFMITGDLK